MIKAFDYGTAVLRNSGYVSDATQKKIRQTTLLIAGCGIGSSPAICAARMGFENFVLVDGDVVDAHNLNRQFYDFSQIGLPKVDALKAQILRVNPNAQVTAINEYLDAHNTDSIVAKGDIVFDTVDFLDLPAILGLHSSARRQAIPIFTALSVGFGALVWYFAPGQGPSLVDILAPGWAQAESKDRSSYAAAFAPFIQHISPSLDGEVVDQVTKVLTLMKEGKPCPASQVAVGSFAIGAMAISMIRDLLEGEELPRSPRLVIHSFKNHKTTVLDVLQGWQAGA